MKAVRAVVNANAKNWITLSETVVSWSVEYIIELRSERRKNCMFSYTAIILVCPVTSPDWALNGSVRHFSEQLESREPLAQRKEMGRLINQCPTNLKLSASSIYWLFCFWNLDGVIRKQTIMTSILLCCLKGEVSNHQVHYHKYSFSSIARENWHRSRDLSQDPLLVLISEFIQSWSTQFHFPCVNCVTS